MGGYASGTVAGALTRRYHALLVAALPPPLGRVVILNSLSECIVTNNGKRFCPGAEHTFTSGIALYGLSCLKEFRLESGIPVWRYNFDGNVLEKRLLMPYRQNTIHITFSLLSSGGSCSIELRPFLQFRSHDSPLGESIYKSYSFIARGNRYEITGENSSPVLRLFVIGNDSRFTLDGGTESKIHHSEEAQRGYDFIGQLWSPGIITAKIYPGANVTLVASSEPWETVLSLSPEEALKAHKARISHLLSSSVPDARDEIAAELVIAADQFIITPERDAKPIHTQESDTEARSVIAGYHWFTDWGRDTMISLEGLTLVTGRLAEARWILRTFGQYIYEGLIPNLFPEGQHEGMYNTADATLWFFHALHRYLQYSSDRETLLQLLDSLLDIVEYHLEGTLFGIGVDKKDGLLRQGEEGYQLTWMDAKVGDWVVTPRRGKAVEINALWFNALVLLEEWVRRERGVHESSFLSEAAQRAYRSFNERFWYKEGGYLYDVVDGEQGYDTSLRPNQILAVSLDNPVLDKNRWGAIVNIVRERLLTPFGLRTLDPGHPMYKSVYYGDLRARDAAYHQGTVWAWLIGPFIDAWLKVNSSDKERARKFLEGFGSHLDEGCVGSISEIFDAEPPFTPRGCIAQAWSVAEVLRCLVKTA